MWVELCGSVGEEEENEGGEMSVEKVWLSVRGGVRGMEECLGMERKWERFVG